MFDHVKMELINNVDDKKVQEIVNSILVNGWVGSPILYHNSIGLITGSHRVKALTIINEMYENENLTDDQVKIVEKINNTEEYVLDVTYIIDEWMENNPGEEWEYDSIGKLFEGTEVEIWKDEIVEW
ncbi:hypothetical protein PU629_07360 [Pullulanibacillus sp. KACC 23026]|uniref:hypothetical protein n=1 Tax=Pullulanibacillus sp. KACC 23026 TaxID=3028315 RepID=UPI0023AFF55A|nr:hypothetical protein [Pullulanibacillus sp. KACC 23026]WEG14175.1 hypothetical protein PU629_07360 [Pullulanibacillus sp. KACC 23026]